MNTTCLTLIFLATKPIFVRPGPEFNRDRNHHTNIKNYRNQLPNCHKSEITNLFTNKKFYNDFTENAANKIYKCKSADSKNKNYTVSHNKNNHGFNDRFGLSFKRKYYKSGMYGLGSTVSKKFQPILPPIQPVLDAISLMYQQISNKVDSELTIALGKIQGYVNSFFLSGSALIETIVANGNLSLKNGLKLIFNTSISSFDIGMEVITNQIQTNSDYAIDSGFTTALMLIKSSVDQNILDSQNLLDNFSRWVPQNINLALYEANLSLYNQISQLLNSLVPPANIIPQLIFPDPVAISELIIPSTDNLYQLIDGIWNPLIQEIPSIIDTSAKKLEQLETDILNAGNINIDNTITAEVQNILNSTNDLIKTVTAQEIAEIKKGLDTDTDGLILQIQNAVNSMINNIDSFIISETQESLKKITALITLNNQEVINYISIILS